MRLAIALAIPVIAALTVTGTYLGKEVVVAAAWLSVGVVGMLFVRPMAGIAIMVAGFMLATYPVLPSSLGGVLTVNNLLGLGFVVLVVMHILETRDFSFLRTPQIRLLCVIGIVFLIGSFYADATFPLLQQSRGKRLVLDRTSDMAHDFVTRLAFLVFFWIFVRTRADIRVIFLTFMFSLFAAVPSAIVNWMQGGLVAGFRAAASLTTGANPNRLAMICLTEVGCWWFWSHLRPTKFRALLTAVAISASVVLVFASGSRSGLLGFGVLLLLLQTGPRQYRVPLRQVAFMGGVAVLGVLAIVPPESWERMINFAPERHTFGFRSTMMREDTVFLGFRMLRDHPLFGVGLGNFREVARQVYLDPFFRPPHNSYLWAMAEGGVPGFLGYALLLAVCWRDLHVAMGRAQADPEIGFVAAGLRAAFGMFLFFSIFADNFTSPITHILVAQIMVLRRYVDGLPVPARAMAGGQGVSRAFVTAVAPS
ncbi:MAG: O-antigen ligase family protein [Candidatus Binatia bacterium]